MSDASKLETWMIRAALFLLAAFVPFAHAEKQLLFVSALWRHGDRVPDYTFPADRVDPSAWKEGGAGREKLSTAGMKMHYILGKALRARYITSESPLLSRNYSASEIYVHSTVFNQSINSTTANLIAMYSEHANSKDAPNLPEWPFGPIPIHTVPGQIDHMGNPYANCSRQKQLFKLLKKSREFQQFWNSSTVQEVLLILSKNAGIAKVEPEMLWKIVNTLRVEEIYYSEQVNSWYPWYATIRKQLRKISSYLKNLHNGIGLFNSTVCGVDIPMEFKKIRGGVLLNTVKEYMRKTLDAKEKGPKYFVLSAHDPALMAYLSVLGAKRSTRGDYPRYAACILTELWRDAETGEAFVKVLYDHGLENTVIFTVITKYVTGCDEDFCPFKVFEKLANTFDPGNIDAVCDSQLEESCAAAPLVPPGHRTHDSSSHSVQPSLTETLTQPGGQERYRRLMNEVVVEPDKIQKAENGGAAGQQ